MAPRSTRSAATKALLAEVEKQEPQQLSSPPVTPSSAKKTPAAKRAVKPKSSATVKKEANDTLSITPASTGRKRKRAAVKVEEDINELPHNLGKIVTKKEDDVVDEVNSKEKPPAKRARTRKTAASKDVKTELQATVDTATAVADHDEAPQKKPRKPKANPYGLTPGESPYPDWPHPTPEECQEVNDLLSEVHGKVQAPATIPAPSTTVSGCGEVPSILDALIRTLLSAATTGTNSSRAFKGLVDTFGLREEGIGKGSVDWDKVRLADVKEAFEAIKSGGLADTKSKRIKEILEMVYKENKDRRDALVEAKEEGGDEPAGAQNETEKEKEDEIIRADEHVLSLDHLHALSSDEALSTLIKYPGIGPKTASCVLLFCMQRPSFAVDTHVFRLCKWLNWVPPDKATPKVDRNTTYSHCEVRIPDHLKYPLHQLIIRHGKTCPRCRAATRENSEDWDKGCPIDHLVTRTGKRKGGGGASPAKKAKKGKKGKKEAESDEETEEEVVEEEEIDEDEADEEGEDEA